MNRARLIGASEHVFRFIQISDLHLSIPRIGSWSEYANKRLIGYISWQRHRSRKHPPNVLDALVRQLRDCGDHIVVTGDLTQLGTAEECSQARNWLQNTASPHDLTVIPGNHDVYVKDSWADTLGLWQPWMTSDGETPTVQYNFPLRRQRGPVVFIGLCSAVPTAPTSANGTIDGLQLEKLADMLVEARNAGLFRVILVHHSPIAGMDNKNRRLTNAEALRALLARHGAELVLHGHCHRISWSHVPGPDNEIPVLCPASASATGWRRRGYSPRHRSSYHHFSVSRSKDEWCLGANTLVLNEDGDGVHEIAKNIYFLSAPPAVSAPQQLPAAAWPRAIGV